MLGAGHAQRAQGIWRQWPDRTAGEDPQVGNGKGRRLESDRYGHHDVVPRDGMPTYSLAVRQRRSWLAATEMLDMAQALFDRTLDYMKQRNVVERMFCRFKDSIRSLDIDQAN